MSREQEIRLYYEGLREGIRRYAVYSNGEQLVGVMRRPLHIVLADIDREEQEHLADGT